MANDIEMSHSAEIKYVRVKEFESLIGHGTLSDFVIVRGDGAKWHVEFNHADLVTKKIFRCSLITQRKKLKTWTDPRHLADYLVSKGVFSGEFILQGEHDVTIKENNQ